MPAFALAPVVSGKSKSSRDWSPISHSSLARPLCTTGSAGMSFSNGMATCSTSRTLTAATQQQLQTTTTQKTPPQTTFSIASSKSPKKESDASNKKEERRRKKKKKRKKCHARRKTKETKGKSKGSFLSHPTSNQNKNSRQTASNGLWPSKHLCKQRRGAAP